MRVVSLGRANDDINDARKTAAAFATFFHGMIDFTRCDQLPFILIKEACNDVFNVLRRNEITAANNHPKFETRSKNAAIFKLLLTNSKFDMELLAFSEASEMRDEILHPSYAGQSG